MLIEVHWLFGSLAQTALSTSLCSTAGDDISASHHLTMVTPVVAGLPVTPGYDAPECKEQQQSAPAAAATISHGCAASSVVAGHARAPVPVTPGYNTLDAETPTDDTSE